MLSAKQSIKELKDRSAKSRVKVNKRKLFGKLKRLGTGVRKIMIQLAKQISWAVWAEHPKYPMVALAKALESWENSY